ncbi:MAG: serine hydrolase [Pleurocapsa sp. MO_226.B13]|nr:serine hydrolase [Pleurocapsa sp. MO_226.B13]
MTNNQINNAPKYSASQLEAALTQTTEDLGLSDIGVSVGIVTPDGAWTGATGISNIDTQQATKPDDLFNIASISKAYTSSVILKLQEQGKLSLDDTIDKWLPEIANQITNGDDLTIRQLLNGKGGLWDYSNNEEFESDILADYLSGSNRDWQPEDLVAYAFGKPLFSGGFSTEIWTYTNTGNVIAALIAEEATGMLFKDILAEEILEPLGLTNTFFTSEEVSLEQRARGYEDIFTADGHRDIDGIPEDYSIVNTATSYGNGSIVSSAEDVAKFVNSLASGELLESESTAEIFNYVSTGRPVRDKFGLGVFPLDYPWGETRSMTGSIFGYKSDVDYWLNSDTTISVLLNERSLRSDLVRLAYKASIANTLGLNDGSVIDGTEAEDYLIGTLTNDVINGLAGNDILIGKKGLDALDGGEGNDLIEGGKGNDVLFGKEGNDSLYGGKDDDFLNGGEGDDFLEGGKGRDSLIGGNGRDNINGGKDDDTLSGGAGDDIVRDTQGKNLFFGNDGDDLLFAGKEMDRLYGDAGNDRLIANAGNDSLLGGSGDDYLNGGAGDDNLLGMEGDDILIGSSGSNLVSGGDGSDRFVLSTEGTAIITDFTQGEDFLELPENISFKELEIIQGSGDIGNDTLINWQLVNLAVLSNIDATEINTSDFINLSVCLG